MKENIYYEMKSGHTLYIFSMLKNGGAIGIDLDINGLGFVDYYENIDDQYYAKFDGITLKREFDLEPYRKEAVIFIFKYRFMEQ